jgi:hypothetical protein
MRFVTRGGKREIKKNVEHVLFMLGDKFLSPRVFIYLCVIDLWAISTIGISARSRI